MGISAKKGFLKDMFGILSTAFVATLVSVVISTPFNFLISDGSTGNIWGDGLIELFQDFGMNRILSCIIGEYYLDFLDKTLTLLLLFCFITAKNSKRISSYLNQKKDNNKDIKLKASAVSVVFAILSVLALSSSDITVFAAEDKYSIDEYNFKNYTQTIYNGENGFPGGKANDIVQTKDGVIWIGTYGGLYRYCGNEMKWMNNFDSSKHSGIISYFNLHYVKEGHFDKGISKLISSAFNMREKADYEDFFCVCRRCRTAN